LTAPAKTTVPVPDVKVPPVFDQFPSMVIVKLPESSSVLAAGILTAPYTCSAPPSVSVPGLSDRSVWMLVNPGAESVQFAVTAVFPKSSVPAVADTEPARLVRDG
jgi:hypothetical protein